MARTPVSGSPAFPKTTSGPEALCPRLTTGLPLSRRKCYSVARSRLDRMARKSSHKGYIFIRHGLGGPAGAFPIDARDRKLCVPASRRVYPCLDELLVLSNLNYRPSDPIVNLFVVYLAVYFRGQAPPLPAEPGCSRQDPENWPQGTTGNRMAASATRRSQTQATFCYASGFSVGWRLPRRTW